AAPGPPALQRVAVWLDRFVTPQGHLIVQLWVQPGVTKGHPEGVIRRQRGSDLTGMLPYPVATPPDPAAEARQWAGDPVLGHSAPFPKAPATPVSHQLSNYGAKGP